VRRRAGPLRAVVLAGLAALPASAGEEVWRPCPGGGWWTAGADPTEHGLVCKGVAAAFELLSGCGVEVTEAGRVRLVDALPVFCDSAAYGMFDAGAGEIRLGRPALCRDTAPAGSIFQSLPTEAAFTALAAHEAAHALLFAVGLGAERRLEHEYIAGVVQHAALGPAHRAAALEATGVIAPASEAEFNPFLLSMAPASYAAKAWLDFDARPDGCALLRAFATGAARLPELPDL